MAYYNNYPLSYQPYMQQSMPAANTQQGVIWVQGEAAAKSYLVAPGSTVQLWDSEEKVIYLKSADTSGMPSMKILDYTIRGEEQKKTEQIYATKADLDALAEKVKELARRKRPVKEEENDE